MDTIDKAREVLTKAVDAHVAAGKTLVSSSFGWGDRCCALSCVVGNHSSVEGSPINRAAATLGWTLTEAWAFVDGFDGHPYHWRHEGEDAFKLGKELRERYRPVHASA